MDKCYIAHGGKELVIGGKLTVLPGAVVEGLEVTGIDLEVEESKATTVAALRDDLNALIRALKGGPAPEPETAEEESEEE